MGKALMDTLKQRLPTPVRRFIRLRWGPIETARLRVVRVGPTLQLWRRERYEIKRARALLNRKPTGLVVTIIPTYRRGDLLLRAIDSALQQTVTDHAVLVVDDGGGVPAMPRHPRLTVLSLSRNCGVVGVVYNIGIGVSDSKFLAFLNDDNEWSPNHLALSLEAHARGPELTYTAMRRVRPDGSEVDILSWPFSRGDFRHKGSVDANTVVVRRRRGVVFSRIPRRFGEYPAEDWEFVFRLSRTMRVEHIPSVTVTYLMNPRSYWTSW
jgi:hypothetical protein